jgi:hypothetical protein
MGQRLPRSFCAEERFASDRTGDAIRIADPAIASEVLASRVERRSSELLYLNVKRQLPFPQSESPSTFSPKGFFLKKVAAIGHR